MRRLDYQTSKRLETAIKAGDLATLATFPQDLRAWLSRELPSGNQSVLGYAACHGKGHVVGAMLRLGCDPNEPTRLHYANTPLTEASGGDVKASVFPDPENVRVLLAHGALVDSHAGSTISPLQMAAMTGNVVAAKLLVEAGADLYWEGKTWQPPLDNALSWQVAGGTQPAVAEFLRSVGATVTYREWHNWQDPQLEFMERAIGIVSPRPIVRMLGKASVALYKSRLAARNFENQLLFSRGLAPFLNVELGVVTSKLWPLHKGALLEHRFSWPVELLFRLAASVIAGAKLEHGSVLREADEVLGGLSTPVPEWIVAKSGRIEEARAVGGWVGTVPVLLLTPVLTKKRYKPGKEALAEADKRAAWKWERLHLPLPDLTPVGYEYLKQLDEPADDSGG